ncbi:unnamed protein product [Coregonus sp. 'balchen']|nr:unnamed protein product [Coregonus sp. 'balchen']
MTLPILDTLSQFPEVPDLGQFPVIPVVPDRATPSLVDGEPILGSGEPDFFSSAAVTITPTLIFINGKHEVTLEPERRKVEEEAGRGRGDQFEGNVTVLGGSEEEVTPTVFDYSLIEIPGKPDHEESSLESTEEPFSRTPLPLSMSTLDQIFYDYGPEVVHVASTPPTPPEQVEGTTQGPAVQPDVTATSAPVTTMVGTTPSKTEQTAESVSSVSETTDGPNDVITSSTEAVSTVSPSGTAVTNASEQTQSQTSYAPTTPEGSQQVSTSVYDKEVEGSGTQPPDNDRDAEVTRPEGEEPSVSPTKEIHVAAGDIAEVTNSTSAVPDFEISTETPLSVSTPSSGDVEDVSVPVTISDIEGPTSEEDSSGDQTPDMFSKVKASTIDFVSSYTTPHTSTGQVTEYTGASTQATHSTSTPIDMERSGISTTEDDQETTQPEGSGEEVPVETTTKPQDQFTVATDETEFKETESTSEAPSVASSTWSTQISQASISTLSPLSTSTAETIESATASLSEQGSGDFTEPSTSENEAKEDESSGDDTSAVTTAPLHTTSSSTDSMVTKSVSVTDGTKGVEQTEELTGTEGHSAGSDSRVAASVVTFTDEESSGDLTPDMFNKEFATATSPGSEAVMTKSSSPIISSDPFQSTTVGTVITPTEEMDDTPLYSPTADIETVELSVDQTTGLASTSKPFVTSFTYVDMEVSEISPTDDDQEKSQPEGSGEEAPVETTTEPQDQFTVATDETKIRETESTSETPSVESSTEFTQSQKSTSIISPSISSTDKPTEASKASFTEQGIDDLTIDSTAEAERTEDKSSDLTSTDDESSGDLTLDMFTQESVTAAGFTDQQVMIITSTSSQTKTDQTPTMVLHRTKPSTSTVIIFTEEVKDEDALFSTVTDSTTPEIITKDDTIIDADTASMVVPSSPFYPTIFAEEAGGVTAVTMTPQSSIAMIEEPEGSGTDYYLSSTIDPSSLATTQIPSVTSVNISAEANAEVTSSSTQVEDSETVRTTTTSSVEDVEASSSEVLSTVAQTTQATTRSTESSSQTAFTTPYIFVNEFSGDGVTEEEFGTETTPSAPVSSQASTHPLDVSSQTTVSSEDDGFLTDEMELSTTPSPTTIESAEKGPSDEDSKVENTTTLSSSMQATVVSATATQQTSLYTGEDRETVKSTSLLPIDESSGDDNSEGSGTSTSVVETSQTTTPTPDSRSTATKEGEVTEVTTPVPSTSEEGIFGEDMTTWTPKPSETTPSLYSTEKSLVASISDLTSTDEESSGDQSHDMFTKDTVTAASSLYITEKPTTSSQETATAESENTSTTTVSSLFSTEKPLQVTTTSHETVTDETARIAITSSSYLYSTEKPSVASILDITSTDEESSGELTPDMFAKGSPTTIVSPFDSTVKMEQVTAITMPPEKAIAEIEKTTTTTVLSLFSTENTEKAVQPSVMPDVVVQFVTTFVPEVDVTKPRESFQQARSEIAFTQHPLTDVSSEETVEATTSPMLPEVDSRDTIDTVTTPAQGSESPFVSTGFYSNTI